MCVCVCSPILRIPTLAIHLNREVNSDGFKFNAQTHLLPVLSTAIKEYRQWWWLSVRWLLVGIVCCWCFGD